MKSSLILSFSLIFLLLISCQDHSEPVLKESELQRFRVLDQNPDSLQLMTVIKKDFDKDGNMTSSVYYSADGDVVMNFNNTYENGLKTRIDWVNASDSLIRFVDNSYNELGQLVRSETKRPNGEIINGFIHRWTDDDLIEEKMPIGYSENFKPNAIYFYTAFREQDSLVEFDENDAILAEFKWNYISFDENGQWTERHWFVDGELRRIERQSLAYQTDE